MTFRRPRRWSQLNRVERVDLYTRYSLYVVLWGFVVSLSFGPAGEATDDAEMTRFIVGAVIVTAFGTRLLAAVLATYPARPVPWVRLALLVIAAGVYVGTVGLPAGTGSAIRGSVVALVVINLSVGLGGVPDRRVLAALTAGSALFAFGLSDVNPFSALAGAATAGLAVYTVRASLWMYGIVAELDAARDAQSRLAVAEERLRFSRDVHDVLGRRLSTIAVQAELAATLAERGDTRAGARMLEVRAVAHEALAEARELARGYRPTNLTHELDGARSLLRSAGIDVVLDVGVVPRAWQEAAGWVVREGVTNVLRHSDARTVTITFADDLLRVANDGVHAPSPATAGGAGLRGLAERLEPLGATLDIRPEGEQWTIVAHLPGTGPISATRPATETPA